MADGRKNNGGHSTKGRAGRKPKIEELRKIEMMDSVGDPSSAWAALWGKVQDGDVTAIKAWIEHRFGKPTETKDVNLKSGVKGFIINGVDPD